VSQMSNSWSNRRWKR